MQVNRMILEKIHAAVTMVIEQMTSRHPPAGLHRRRVAGDLAAGGPRGSRAAGDQGLSQRRHRRGRGHRGRRPPAGGGGLPGPDRHQDRRCSRSPASTATTPATGANGCTSCRSSSWLLRRRPPQGRLQEPWSRAAPRPAGGFRLAPLPARVPRLHRPGRSWPSCCRWSAPIGAIVNWRLVEQLGETAMNAYRLRWFAGSVVRDVSPFAVEKLHRRRRKRSPAAAPRGACRLDGGQIRGRDIRRPQRLGRAVATPGCADQRDDVVAPPRHPGDRQLGRSRPCPARWSAGPPTSPLWSRLSPREPRLEDADVTVGRRPVLEPVTADQAARQHAVGRDADAEVATGRQDGVLDATGDDRVLDLQVNDRMDGRRPPQGRGT